MCVCTSVALFNWPLLGRASELEAETLQAYGRWAQNFQIVLSLLTRQKFIVFYCLHACNIANFCLDQKMLGLPQQSLTTGLKHCLFI